MQTTNERTNPRDERLAALNDALGALDIAALTLAEAMRLGERVPRDELRNILSRAADEPNVKIHLKHLIRDARQMAPPGTEPDPPARMNRPTYFGAVPAGRGNRTEPAPVTHLPQRAASAPPEEPSFIDDPEPAQDTAKARSRYDDPTQRASFHIYGGKGALTIEAATRKQDRGTEQHVVFIDAAQATAPRTYNWEQKLMFMLLPAEIPGALAVLMGQLPSIEFRNHGEEKDKALSIAHQGDKVFIKLLHARRAVAVPVMPEDALRLAAILLRQMTRNQFGIGNTEALALLRSVYVPMKAPAPARRTAQA